MIINFNRFRNAAKYLADKRPDIFCLEIYNDEMILTQEYPSRMYVYNMNTRQIHING